MFGVCYYPEHWPEARWATDAQLMHEAGLELVRIGEFAWSKMEPYAGQYEWDWLDRAIETLAAASLRVILGTPTAAPPAWLTTRYPEVLRVARDGRQLIHGARRHVNLASPTYQELSAEIVTAMAERYGQHPAVVAWQIDNEFGCHDSSRCYSEASQRAFQQWLQERYSTLDALNDAWGTVFWSQTYTAWEQIPVPLDAIPPVTGHNPSLELDYRRWASDANVAFAQMQAALIRPRSPGRTITTNLSPADDKLDWFDMAAAMDVISLDNYPHAFPNAATVAQIHDLTYAFSNRSFWIMEQQCGHVNWSDYNPPVPSQQVRLWVYQGWLHRAETIVYFRWRASRYGQEQYHSGLLNQAAQTTQGYREAAQVAQEWPQRTGVERTPAQVALLYSFDDQWTHQIDPHNGDFDYWELTRTLYEALWRRGVAVDIVRRGRALDGYTFVIAPAPIVIDADEAHAWHTFVAQGGTLLLTCRSFVKSQSNLWTDQPLPALLTDLFSAEVQAWASLAPAEPMQIGNDAGNTFSVPIWAEALHPDQAEVLLRYQSGPYAGQAALTMHRNGQGRACYLGAYPIPALLDWLWTQVSPGEVLVLPAEVEAIPLTDGWALLNHTGAPQSVPLAGIWYDRTHDESFVDVVPLAPRDVRILQQKA